MRVCRAAVNKDCKFQIKIFDQNDDETDNEQNEFYEKYD